MIKINAAIYARVSSEMQADNFSIDSQLRICRAFCEMRGYSVAAIYIDDGFSAKTTERPQFKQMMSEADGSKFSVIVCHKIDRFSRSITDVLMTLKQLEASGITFASATEQFDFTTPIGRVFLALLAAFAQWYVDNLSAETTRGKREKAAQGIHNNRAPLGYIGSNENIEPSEHAAAIVAAFTDYANGSATDYSISITLSEATGKPVGKDTVAAILKNPFYAGFVRYRGYTNGKPNPRSKTKLIIGKHTPIISQELYDEVQRVRRTRERHGGSPPSDRVYLLGKQLARCSVCGYPLRAKAITDKNYALSYRCTSREANRPCSASQSPVREAHLVSQIEQFVSAVTLPREIVEAHKAAADDTTGADKIEGTRRNLKAELERTVLMFQKGVISESKLDIDTERIKSSLSALAPVTRRTTDEAADTIISVAAAWDKATKAEQSVMLRILLDGVVVDTTKKEIVGVIPHHDFLSMFEASKQLRYLVDGNDGHEISRRGMSMFKLP